MTHEQTGRQFTAVLADDHHIVRAGLRMALETPGLIEESGLNVVAEASNGLETIEAVKIHRPHLLLLDVTMPLASGAEILVDIKRWSPDTKIVVLTAVSSSGLLASMIAEGVHGMFAKASDNQELFQKLPLILRGGRHIEASLVDLIKNATPLPELTSRERQTLNMLVSGRSNREIAEVMGISPKTAEKHRASLMAKLEVNSLVELMAKALREGLIEDQKVG